MSDNQKQAEKLCGLMRAYLFDGPVCAAIAAVPVGLIGVLFNFVSWATEGGEWWPWTTWALIVGIPFALAWPYFTAFATAFYVLKRLEKQ